MICNVNMVVHAYVHLFASVFFDVESHVVPEYSKNHVSSGFRGVYISQLKAKYITIIWYVYTLVSPVGPWIYRYKYLYIYKYIRI